MPRGFQIDVPATEAAYKKGLLIDSKGRSFISKPKLIEGENDEPQPHMILAGPDATNVRMHVFRREKNKCQRCGLLVTWGSEDYMAGELHHIRHKPWNRCWCPGNLELVCRRCHRGEHSARAPRFGAEKVAV